MKKVWMLSALILLLAGGYFGWKKMGGREETREFETQALSRGSILRTITSTGSLNPMGAVEVGSQVSGIIAKVHADFNDVVTKNQLLVELDPSFLLGSLDEARAAFARAEALYMQAEAEFKRNQPLLEKGFLSEQEFAKIRTDYFSQKAALQSAKASVQKASTNLSYASIHSPISGKVIQRNVEPGQTVSASLSAPTLFIIAEDLSAMEILAKVDEGDIGRIHKDQDVTFSVQAYPDRVFKGKVSQIRLQPEEIQNVVTYTVVIHTHNPDGTLLPGMTATVDFIEEKIENALLLPGAALRFSPPEEWLVILEEKRQAMREARKNDKDTSAQKNFNRPERSGGRKTARPVVWIFDEKQNPLPVFVRLGQSDGIHTEIVGSRPIELTEGSEIIVGILKKEDKAKKQTSLFGGQKGPRRSRY